MKQQSELQKNFGRRPSPFGLRRRSKWENLEAQRTSTSIRGYRQTGQNRVFCEACHGKLVQSSLVFLFRTARVATVQWFGKKSGAYHTSFNHQRYTKRPESNAKIKAVKIGAKMKALITSRSFPREIPVLRRFFERRFQPLSVGGFFSNQRESISWCPKSPFLSKTQNRQIARTSPLKRLRIGMNYWGEHQRAPQSGVELEICHSRYIIIYRRVVTFL